MSTGNRKPMHHSDSLAEAFRERLVPVDHVDSNIAISVLATPYDLPIKRGGTPHPATPTSRSNRRNTRGHRKQRETNPFETCTPTSSGRLLREIELSENTSLDESYSSCMAIAPTCNNNNNCDNDKFFSARRISLGGSPIPIDSTKIGGDARAFRDTALSPKSGHVGRVPSPTIPQAAGFEHRYLASTPRHHSSTYAASPPLPVVRETETQWTHSPSRATPTIAESTTARSNFTMGVSFPSAWKRRSRYSRT
jgi:hypothetical protein